MCNLVDIKLLDKKTTFLHYTDRENIENIFQIGLLPKIGQNSKNIELSKKVFFTEGFDNTLLLMDSWIKWLVLKPKNNIIYINIYFYQNFNY